MQVVNSIYLNSVFFWQTGVAIPQRKKATAGPGQPNQLGRVQGRRETSSVPAVCHARHGDTLVT